MMSGQVGAVVGVVAQRSAPAVLHEANFPLEARAAREELVRAREALSTDRSTAIADQATARVSAARARDDVRAAFAEKELLDADPLLCEVEECERADAFANGVEGRLRDAAASADKQRMDSRIAGLYDEQAQRTFEETGLVVGRAGAAGVASGLLPKRSMTRSRSVGFISTGCVGKFVATGADAAAMLAEIEALFARKFDEA